MAGLKQLCQPLAQNLETMKKLTCVCLSLLLLTSFFAGCFSDEERADETPQLKSATEEFLTLSSLPSSHKMRFGFNFGFLNDYIIDSASPFQRCIDTVETDFDKVRLRTNGILRKGYNPSSNDIFDDSLIVNRIDHIVGTDSHYLLVSIVSLPYKIPNGDFSCPTIQGFVDNDVPCTIDNYLGLQLLGLCNSDDINENRFYPNIFNTQFNVDTFSNWMIEFCEELNDSGQLGRSSLVGIS